MTITTTSPAVQQDLRALLQRFIDDVINAQDLDRALVETVAKDFIELKPLPGQGPGRAGLADVLAMMFTGFPDLRWTIHDTLVEGDRVMGFSGWRAGTPGREVEQCSAPWPEVGPTRRRCVVGRGPRPGVRRRGMRARWRGCMSRCAGTARRSLVAAHQAPPCAGGRGVVDQGGDPLAKHRRGELIHPKLAQVRSDVQPNLNPVGLRGVGRKPACRDPSREAPGEPILKEGIQRSGVPRGDGLVSFKGPENLTTLCRHLALGTSRQVTTLPVRQAHRRSPPGVRRLVDRALACRAARHGDTPSVHPGSSGR